MSTNEVAAKPAENIPTKRVGIIVDQDAIAADLAASGFRPKVAAGLAERGKELAEEAAGLVIMTGSELYAKVREHRLLLRRMRIAAQNACKAGRAEALEIQRLWLDAEKDAVAIVEPAEKALHAIEKEAEEREERERNEYLDKRIAAFAEYGRAETRESVAAMADDVYARALSNAKAEHEAKQAEAQRLREEAEAAEQLRKENEELRRQLDEAEKAKAENAEKRAFDYRPPEPKPEPKQEPKPTEPVKSPAVVDELDEQDPIAHIRATAPRVVFLNLGDLDGEYGTSFDELDEITWSADPATKHVLRYVLDEARP